MTRRFEYVFALISVGVMTFIVWLCVNNTKNARSESVQSTTASDFVTAVTNLQNADREMFLQTIGLASLITLAGTPEFVSLPKEEKSALVFLLVYHFAAEVDPSNVKRLARAAREFYATQKGQPTNEEKRRFSTDIENILGRDAAYAIRW